MLKPPLFVRKQNFVWKIFTNAWRIYCFLPHKTNKKLKAFSHDKEDDSNTPNEDTLDTLQIRKCEWTPPEGQFASLDFFIKKCRHDFKKLRFNRNTKFSNIFSKERSALKSRCLAALPLPKRSFAATFWHLFCKSWQRSHFHQPKHCQKHD